MRWQADRSAPVRNLVWICLVLTVAAFGSVVVRNVTETLVGITHQPSMAVAQRPSR
jgi:hypothetical protein